MSGWQACEALRERAPGTRLYLVSGWARQIGEDDPRLVFVDGILSKPLDVGVLRRLLVGEANGVAGGDDKLGMLPAWSPTSPRER